jgi:hypothetical protein
MTLFELKLIKQALELPDDDNFSKDEALRIINREINLKTLDPTK